MEARPLDRQTWALDWFLVMWLPQDHNERMAKDSELRKVDKSLFATDSKPDWIYLISELVVLVELSSALFRQRPLALQARCGGTHFELGVLTNGTTPPVLNRQRKDSNDSDTQTFSLRRLY